MGITADLARFGAEITKDALPGPVAERTRYLLLDLVGNMVRGRSADSTPALISAVNALGLDRGEIMVLGDPRRYAPAGAALAAGAFAHSLDFDDTHAASTLHPGAPVIAAALTAAQMSHATGAAVLAAIVAGYETTCRIGLALPAGDHYQRGFHPTATCGAFGAAVAAGRIFGLEVDAMISALGIALSQTAGSLQFLADGAWTKRFQVGWAAMSGLAAASLAGAGYRGPAEALEGSHGFLRAYAPAPNPARATEDLGVVFELLATAIKPYPSCRYGHAGIDAALALRARHVLRPEEIDSVTYGLSKAGMLLVGAPAEKKANPKNVVDAQFSGPFVLASALASGQMQLDSYQRLHDPMIRQLMGRIRCEYSEAIEAHYPKNMSGTVRIHARGETFVETVIVPKGEPSNMLTEADLVAKFTSLAEPLLGSRQTIELANAILRVDELDDMASLFRAGVPSRL
jgi:2-methylcitrate dehydratase PrpD